LPIPVLLPFLFSLERVFKSDWHIF
jgi:hypothetical protein